MLLDPAQLMVPSGLLCPKTAPHKQGRYTGRRSIMTFCRVWQLNLANASAASQPPVTLAEQFAGADLGTRTRYVHRGSAIEMGPRLLAFLRVQGTVKLSG